MTEYAFEGDGLRWMGLDIECRPLTWYAGDFVSREITAIACRFVDEKRPHLWLLGKHEPVEILEGFVEQYDKADAVTGHFLRGFDLPVINASLIEYGQAPLGDKLTQDTKLDLVKRSGLSVSQENLGSILGLESPKIGMSQAAWRAANRLTPAGLKLVAKRVVGDVDQQIEMRERLLELGLLKPPSIWSSKPHGGNRYLA